jgi:hypothetical protein
MGCNDSERSLIRIKFPDRSETLEETVNGGGVDVTSRRDIVYLALAGFFVTNAILGLTGGKLLL